MHDSKRSISYQASTTRGWQNWTRNQKPKLPIPNVRRPAGAGASPPTTRRCRRGGAALRVRLRLKRQTTRRRPSESSRGGAVPPPREGGTTDNNRGPSPSLETLPSTGRAQNTRHPRLQSAPRLYQAHLHKRVYSH